MLQLDDVKQVLSQTDEHTLTLYVDVDNATQGNQGNPAGWQIWSRDTLRDMEATLGGDAKEAWPYIRDWVSDYLDSYQPSARSLVIIAGPSFQSAYELPMKFDNQAYFGRPHVDALIWAIDEMEPYLIGMVDQEKARFFVSYLGSVGFQGGLDIDIDDYDFVELTSAQPTTPGTESKGVITGSSGKDDFKDMLDEHRRRFYKDVIERIGRLMETHKADRLVLAGAERSFHAVHDLMDDALKAKVVGMTGVPMYYAQAQIVEAVQPLALEFERRQEMELVDQVVNFARSGGRGALGVSAVREALDMQRVEMLVLNWPLEEETLGNELAFRALQLNSNIELVHGDAAALLHGEGKGVGARLYYAL
jgi:hypothetical protein